MEKLLIILVEIENLKPHPCVTQDVKMLKKKKKKKIQVPNSIQGFIQTLSH